jgi:hypothetical protein
MEIFKKGIRNRDSSNKQIKILRPGTKLSVLRKII